VGELPRETTKGRVLEFVANIANKHNLSLVELTVFPMAVNHESLTVQTSVCNMWSTYLDKVNQKESYPLSQECLQILFNCLISEYLNGVGELESYAVRPTKKARVGKGSLVPKSVVIESSIDSSIDDTASFNACFYKRVTGICYDTFQHVKTIIIKFIFKTVKICSDAFHNEKTITINFIVEMTSLILVQIIIEKKSCEKIAQYNL
jgi:hypothetical protein